MSERRVWTPVQDRALREIVEKKQIKKWSKVSEVMQSEYKILGRTGKQCRERWYNQLNPQINNLPWSEQQEEILFREHDRHGNKWSKIAQQLPGRTDNAIKNHFYSTLRKSIRRLNRFILQTKQKKEMRQIKPLVLSKIIVLSGDKLAPSSQVAPQNIELSIELKKRLIKFAKICDEEGVSQEVMRELVEDIMGFNCNYKRRVYSRKGNQGKVEVQKVKVMESEPKKKEEVEVKSTKNQQEQVQMNLQPPRFDKLQTKKDKQTSSFLSVEHLDLLPRKIDTESWSMHPRFNRSKLLSSSVESLLNRHNPHYQPHLKPQQPDFQFQNYAGQQQALMFGSNNGTELLEGQLDLTQTMKKN